MSIFMFFTGILQGLLLWYLYQTGIRLVEQGRKGHFEANYTPAGGWSPVCLIVPVAANKSIMARALSSLLVQNYPDYEVCFVCASADDPAMPLIQELCETSSNAKIVIAGLAQNCGQKNYNLLAGVNHCQNTEIYAFCDSTHIAQPDFLRCLVEPIVKGQYKFTTGYHQVKPETTDLITLVYTMSVLFMRFLQGVSGCTQLWGGAMAMSRKAFLEYGVAKLWESNVVDDCSLSALLAQDNLRIKLCPAALLTTYAHNYPLRTYMDWLKRQILFLRFCMPGQFLLLGLSVFIMAGPVIWCLLSLLGGKSAATFLSLCWLCFLCWAIAKWRVFMDQPIGLVRWVVVFMLAALLFTQAWISSAVSRSITWAGITYIVGTNGRVKKLSR